MDDFDHHSSLCVLFSGEFQNLGTPEHILFAIFFSFWSFPFAELAGTLGLHLWTVFFRSPNGVSRGPDHPTNRQWLSGPFFS